MQIKWLQTFVVTARCENFRQASEQLFLTQPAVTKHIQRLEEVIHTTLFHRTSNRVTLTAAGKRFYTFANDLLAEYEAGMEAFESWKQGYEQKLVIAVAPQIAASLLPTWLAQFMAENPTIEVITNIVSSYDVGQEVSSGRADLGLARILPIQPSIEALHIHEEPMLLTSKKRQGTWDEEGVMQTDRIMTHNHPRCSDAFLQQLKHAYPLVRTMPVNQIEVTKRFIEAGLGSAYLPYSMIQEMNEVMTIPAQAISPPISTTYLLTKVSTVEVEKFIQFLMEGRK